MFDKVDPKQDFPTLEEKMLRYWEENFIFQKSLEKRKESEKYVFFDGPPFANGLPHYGHILAGALKDAVTRYFSMKGYYVPRINGWDCHGLPVENEVEKELGLKHRKEVVDYGIEKFNTACRESVFRYTNEWNELFKRMGRWVDMENRYATLDNSYMESIWWVFKQLWDKGHVYSGYKPMYISPALETPLSNFEVSQGYKDVTDLTATVKFKLNDDALEAIGAPDEEIYVLAWTTTPWTLPGNVALAFGTNVEYRKVAYKTEEGKQEQYIVAKDLADKVFGENNYLVIDSVDVKKLENKTYLPLFDYYLDNVNGKYCTIQLADFVTTKDGTGIVHIATMFGEDDYYLGEEKGLAKIQHVHMDGTFKDEVTDFAGKFVKGQDGNIAEMLADKGLLFKKENYRHSYPHCWRTDVPLLNYCTRSLFIKVTDVKEKLLANNQKINWQPEHIRDGRFGKWLDGVRDWSISRNRFWGCPIPVWRSEETGEEICIGSIEELNELAEGNLPLRDGELDLHRPYIDEIVIKSPTDGSLMRRIPDVFDCWFESGSMPYAQMHYPFENKEDFEENFPANFIAEGLDQTRGWFYTLHVLATMLFDDPAFRNVIVNGILLAKDGEKLSKRKKNYPDPKLIFDTKGVDSLRFFLYSSTAPLAEDVRFSEDHVDEVVKKFTLTLWNTYSFFVTYANIDDWEPDVDLETFSPKNKLDKWILSELYALIGEVSENMDQYNLTKACRPMLDFVDNLSNWYVRRSRRRFWKSGNDTEKQEAYQTLFMVLRDFSKILAPFMPFMADEIYQNLTGKESVHLADWPNVKEEMVDTYLNNEVYFLRLIVNLGHAVRAKAKIKVRQPLSLVSVALPEGVDPQLVLSEKNVILEELNVKDLKIIKEAGELVEYQLTPNPRVLGPKYGGDVKKILNLAREGKFELIEDGKVRLGDFVLDKDEFEVGYQGKEGYDLESEEGLVVMLDTFVSEELAMEGLAREVVRHIQEIRKEAEFEVDDRIILWLTASGELEKAIESHADYIKRETLSDELINQGDLEWDFEKELTIEGQKIKIAVKRNV